MISNVMLSNTNQRAPNSSNQLLNNNKHVRVNLEGGAHLKIKKEKYFISADVVYKIRDTHLFWGLPRHPQPPLGRTDIPQKIPRSPPVSKTFPGNFHKRGALGGCPVPIPLSSECPCFRNVAFLACNMYIT